MKYEIGTSVVVVCPTDETMDETYLKKIGVVVNHNDNEMTGNTKEDPLHSVKFEDGSIEDFWYEELEKIS